MKDKWLQITREFGIFVRVTNIFVIIMIDVADLDQETYVEENPQKYELVDEETAKKRQRMQQFRSKDKPLLSSEPDSDSDSIFVKVNQNNFNSLGSFHFFTFQVPCIVSFAHFQNCWLLENLLIPLLFNGVIKLSHS